MLTKLEEISLITRCVATDDRHAFERLVEEHAPGVRNFLYRLTMGDAALTDDLSQETFLKAWIGLRSFRAVARFKTWLFSIAYNEFVSYSRKTREMRLPDDIQISDSSGGQPYEPDARATEMRHDIEVAMRNLSETERMLIVLFYMNDLPIKEISRITGLPQGTVKSYLSRAKTKMANELQRDCRSSSAY
ncbi:MAG: RNA polymerase sigma factor [Paramuribaculum sp.]|nr:RNA polymerase sigma factor [Paramuribaculum sp.]